MANFGVPETIIFKISLISTCSSPPTAGSARTQRVRQCRRLAAILEIRIFTPQNVILVVPGTSIFTLKTDQARSGSPAFSSSKWLKLVPEPHIFTLDRELIPEPSPIFHFAAAHTYENLGCPSYPTHGEKRTRGGKSFYCIHIFTAKLHDSRLFYELKVSVCAVILKYSS